LDSALTGASKPAQADPANSKKAAANRVLQLTMGVMGIMFMRLIFVGGCAGR
jgi:hypothetical protein